MGEHARLTDAARTSTWVGDEPGLVESVARWEADLGAARDRLSETATEMARPGPLEPARALRHATAVGLSRLLRVPTRLPADLRDLTFLRQPERWAREATAEAFADQLALGGAATAEVARLIVAAKGLFPRDITDELDRRGISPNELDHHEVNAIISRVYSDVAASPHRAVASLPTTQLHSGHLAGEREVGVRVRRPLVARQLAADTRLSASLMAPLRQLLPQMGGMAPLGFVQLTARQGLEAVDLRFEALNLVEFGLIAERRDVEGLVVARPLPDRADQRVLVAHLPPGVPLRAEGPRPDPAAALESLIALTLEPALTHGTFWADPAPEHLLVDPDGRLVLAGVGAAGHLSPDLRRAGIGFLTSLVSGDAEGQVEAMRLAGAVPPGVDLVALVEDLRSADSLQVTTILMGGEQALLAGLRDATHIMLAHQLQPPLEVVLLLRTVFALGSLAEQVAPGGGGLMAALLPLFQRLPELIADAERTEPSSTIDDADEPTGD
jgi:ubiquinone biosynthesis protein